MAFTFVDEDGEERLLHRRSLSFRRLLERNKSVKVHDETLPRERTLFKEKAQD
jgi:hypothetical protein